MRFEEDYIMRIIKDMIKALACVIFGKRFTEYEVEEEKADDTDFLYRDIIEMADKGKINEAENILLTDMDQTDKRYMEMAMSFYLHINQYTDEFLAANGYSRQEILDGVEALAAANGIEGLEELSEDLYLDGPSGQEER
ncbi:DUF6483 family protein [Blautia marasmi]|uniref:DUF6483 family protein n=1 Tax=Blautia marasmi TaxID=1917868 RepID=UPI000CF231DC|nr:DUF6483 family protein [Blautia marasmi]